MDDISALLFGTVGIVVAFFIGFVIASWSNPYWRCKILRNFTKKPYVVANLKRKDGVLLTTHVVNTENDVITMGQDVWVVQRGTVYLTRVVKSGKKMERELLKETGKTITDADLKQELGVPTVFLTMDDITTISLDAQPSSNDVVKPNEVGSTLLSWIYNQYAKGLASQKTAQLLIILAIFFSLVAAGIAYFDLQKIDALDKKLTNFQEAVLTVNKPPTTPTQKIVNGTVVITAPAAYYPTTDYSIGAV